MNAFRKLTMVTLAAPIALTLASCDSGAAGDGATSGEALDPIAAPDGTQWADTVIATEEGGFQVGNPDAPIKLVEFASHTCGGCAGFAETGAKALLEEYVPTGVVSYEIRNLIRDPLDLTISVLARCGPDETFHPLADQAWANLNQFSQTISSNGAMAEAAMGGPPEGRFIGIAQAAGLVDWFAARGLSRNQAQACLTDIENIEAIAEQSSAQATANNINSTPSFLINGNGVGPQSWETLEPMLQEAGAR